MRGGEACFGCTNVQMGTRGSNHRYKVFFFKSRKKADVFPVRSDRAIGGAARFALRECAGRWARFRDLQRNYASLGFRGPPGAAEGNARGVFPTGVYGHRRDVVARTLPPCPNPCPPALAKSWSI